MLDLFTVLTSGGIVLFQKSQVSSSSTPTHLIDSVISNVFMQGRSNDKEFAQDGYTVKWTFANELGLIFVAVYQKMLELTWVEELLAAAKRMFLKLYSDTLKKGDTTAVINDLNGVTCQFGNWFDARIQSYEGVKGGAATKITMQELVAPLQEIESNTEPPVTSDDNIQSSKDSPVLSPIALKTPVTARLKKGKGRKGKHSPYQSRFSPVVRQLISSGDEIREPQAKTKGKKQRKWGEDGAYEADGDDVLDFSAAPESDVAPQSTTNNLSTAQNSKLFQIVDDDDDDDEESTQTASSRGWGIFSNLTGNKVLTKEDLKAPLEQMHQFLLAKNVANEVSIHLCENVEKSLIGQRTGSFQSTKNIIRKAMEDSLTRILTPTKATDLLHEISTVRKREKRPYTISFVGVNGVGKSTNLSKIAFKLLNNGHSILIAACDTFRSGAVEQLRKHVVNLYQWVDLNAKNKGVKIELFERGYGKDAADVAAHAVKFADAEGFDVVLIDTAGRRHNDQALMGSLGKFAKQAKPDKILMVAEALVGTDSVSQARSFTNALTSANRSLDGFIISKMDTVEDLVGTVVSMVYSTGVPVWFLGVGQMYGDLRDFKVDWIVSKLMKT